MEFRQLRYFAAIVEEGTITAAAKKLHVSQPPLSQQMRALEEEFQVPLFERGARQIRLTEAGRMLYGYATGMLELAASIEEGIENFRNGREGAVRLGLVSSAASAELFSGLSLFRDMSKAIRFKVFEGNTYQLTELLKKGHIELAILRAPFPSYGLTMATLRKDRMTVCGTESFFAGKPEILTAEDLADVPLLIYRRWESFIHDAFDRKEVTPNIFCIADDSRTCLSWARAGLGLAIVPESIARTLSGLTVKILNEESLDSRLVVAKREDVALSGSAQVLFEILSGAGEKAGQ